MIFAPVARLPALLAGLALGISGCGDDLRTFEDPDGTLKGRSGEEFQIELGENPGKAP